MLGPLSLGLMYDMSGNFGPGLLALTAVAVLLALEGVGAGAGGVDAPSLLKPALARGTLRTVAATTWAEVAEGS